MPQEGNRTLSQAVRGSGLSAPEMPEWKKASFGKAPTYGKRTDLSIVEQRRVPPIFKLKEQLRRRSRRTAS